MPNELTADGLTVKSLSEIIADLQTQLQTIYGSDINVSQNSPDGQLIGIFSQSVIDILELLVQTFNSFSVENAFGVALDQRVALNGLARRQGTHTITNITVTTNGAVNLVGLDALVNDPAAIVFTVSDDGGVQYKLIASITTANGANVLAFQANDIGVIQPILNTITNQVTVTADVTSVNNPSAATSIGVAEETDVELKIRHARSFFLASTGPSDAIESALLSIPDVVDAFVGENDTDSPADDIPAFSIWAIVNGGTDAEVGTAIYNKKAPGCGMKGSESYVVTRPNGSSFTSLFDRAETEDLYIKFTATSKIPGVSFNATFLKDSIVAQLFYKLNQSPSIGDIILIMNTIDPRAVLSVVGVSIDGMSYSDIVDPSDFQHYFVLDVARIDITLP